jgi:hypothetical protein
VHSDCVRGFYCDSGSHQCAPSTKTNMSVDQCFDPSGIECASHVCDLTLNECFACDDLTGSGAANNLPIDHPFCNNGMIYTCNDYYESGPPICFGNAPGDANYGKYNCGTSLASSPCPSSAPNCSTVTGTCVCGSTNAQCPGWMVCVNNACKVAAGQPCVNPLDCAYGMCTNGVCPKASSGQLCTGFNPQECTSGACQTVMVTTPNMHGENHCM